LTGSDDKLRRSWGLSGNPNFWFHNFSLRC